jgi:hypothetical protein
MADIELQQNNQMSDDASTGSTQVGNIGDTRDIRDVGEKGDMGNEDNMGNEGDTGDTGDTGDMSDKGIVVENIQTESQIDSPQASSSQITEPALPVIQVEETPVVAPTQINNFNLQGLAEKMKAAIFGRREKKLVKILEYLSTNGKIENNEIRKLVRVSGATATRYMNILEERKKIEQVGTKRHAFYRKV